MDPPHHIHTKSQMFYLEIRPKWPHMAISQVILALPWNSRFFFHLSDFFFPELMSMFILLPLHTCRAEARRKSGQIDLMWPDLRPKNPFQKVIVAKALYGQRYPMPLCWCMMTYDSA